MHLAIDAVGIKHSGGAVVLVDLVAEAGVHAGVEGVTVFTSRASDCNYRLPVSSRVVVMERHLAGDLYLARVLWSQAGLGKAARDVGADIVLAMTGMGRTGRYPPCVLFVQQSLPFSVEAMERSSFRVRLRMRAIRALMRWSSRSAAEIVVQTPTMRRWVSDALGLPEQRVSCFHPAPRSLEAASDPPRNLLPMVAVPDDRRLLYVGNTSPYKNVSTLLAALPALRDRLPGATLFLTWPSDHPALRVEGAVGLGYLDDCALASAYELASALVHPSLVETAALPLSEAASFGTPVLVADRPYAHDICQEAALFFDPLRAEDLVASAVRLLTDSALRATLGAAGRRLVRERRAARPYARLLDHLCQLAPGG